MPALYASLSILTALREANQVGSLQPTTLVSYEAEIERVFDSRDEAALLARGETMKTMFPDVQADEHLLGVYQASGARFYHNDQSIGGIESPHFAAAFFAIWLDERTSAPELRAALLMRQDG